MSINTITTPATSATSEPFITKPYSSYEVLNLDRTSCYWVEPQGLSGFTDETGVSLEALKKHAASGDTLALGGQSGLWTVCESH